MNSYFDMVEQTVKTGKEYCFSTTPNPDFDIWHINFGNIVDTQYEEDWWLAVGGADNRIISEVSSVELENGIKQYNAKVKYFLFDFYDWKDNDVSVENLHKYGIAKCFRIIGSYYFEISWIQGARFPNENEHTELRKTSFEGIDDYDALEKAYNYAIASYNVS